MSFWVVFFGPGNNDSLTVYEKIDNTRLAADEGPFRVPEPDVGPWFHKLTNLNLTYLKSRVSRKYSLSPYPYLPIWLLQINMYYLILL